MPDFEKKLLYGREERFKLLRHLLTRFNPVTTTKKNARIDWLHIRCMACDFHRPLYFDETYDEAKKVCPLCGDHPDKLSGCEPVRPDIEKWWDVLDGGEESHKKNTALAREIAQEEAKKSRSRRQQPEQYFDD